MELTGNYDTDLEVISQFEPDDLVNFCQITNKYVQNLCDNRELWKTHVKKSGLPQLTVEKIMENAKLSTSDYSYWDIGYDHMGSHSFALVSQIYSNTKHGTPDNPYVYWRDYGVGGPVNEIYMSFRAAGVKNVTINDKVVPLTKDVILSRALNPLTEQGGREVAKIRADDSDYNSFSSTVRFHTVKDEYGLRHGIMTNINNVFVANPAPIINPYDIVIPKQTINLDFLNRRFAVNADEPDGFTRIDLLNKAIEIIRSNLNDDQLDNLVITSVTHIEDSNYYISTMSI